MRPSAAPLRFRLSAAVTSIVLAASMLPTAALAEDVTTPQPYINTSGTIDGNVTVDDSAYAALASGRVPDTTATLEVTGDVTNATEGERIVYGGVATGRDGGEGQLDVGGNVTTAPQDESNASKTAKSVSVAGEEGNGSANVGGNVQATSAQETTGVEAKASGTATSSAQATIGGNVTASIAQSNPQSTGRSYGVHAQSGNQATTSVTIGGDVICTTNNPNSTVGTGVNVYTTDESSTTVNVKGSIRIDPSRGAFGSTLYTEGGIARLHVGGDIVANGLEDGVGATLSSKNGGTAELIVQGTIHASNAGIEFSGDKNASLDITVWKIEVDEGGTLTRIDSESPEVPSDVASRIKYIIKLEQPKVGGTLSAVGALKTALDQSHGFDVARAGDKVYLNAVLQPGYYIVGAFNGLGNKVELLHDEGGYYVIVPEGGGVYLTAELGKKEEPAPTPAETQTAAATSSAEETTAVASEPVASPSRALPATSDSQSFVAVWVLALMGGATIVFARRLRD